MRKSFNGLSALIRAELGRTLCRPSIYFFQPAARPGEVDRIRRRWVWHFPQTSGKRDVRAAPNNRGDAGWRYRLHDLQFILQGVRPEPVSDSANATTDIPLLPKDGSGFYAPPPAVSALTCGSIAGTFLSSARSHTCFLDNQTRQPLSIYRPGYLPYGETSSALYR